MIFFLLLKTKLSILYTSGLHFSFQNFFCYKLLEVKFSILQFEWKLCDETLEKNVILQGTRLNFYWFQCKCKGWEPEFSTQRFWSRLSTRSENSLDRNSCNPKEFYMMELLILFLSQTNSYS